MNIENPQGPTGTVLTSTLEGGCPVLQAVGKDKQFLYAGNCRWEQRDAQLSVDARDKFTRVIQSAGEGISGSVHNMISCAAGAVVPEEEVQAPVTEDEMVSCIALVTYVPETLCFFRRIRELSAEWAVVIDNWADLTSLIVERYGVDWLYTGNR
jgi:hypothetical protein